MVELNEPQVWTLIGVFAAGLFGILTLMSTMFVRILRAEIGGLHGRIDGLQGELNGRIDGLQGQMNARFEAVQEQFRRVDTRFDHLDRDVQALARRVFPERD